MNVARRPHAPAPEAATLVAGRAELLDQVSLRQALQPLVDVAMEIASTAPVQDRLGQWLRGARPRDAADHRRMFIAHSTSHRERIVFLATGRYDRFLMRVEGDGFHVVTEVHRHGPRSHRHVVVTHDGSVQAALAFLASRPVLTPATRS